MKFLKHKNDNPNLIPKYKKSALIYVENQTKELCLEAVKYHPKAIKLVNEPFKKKLLCRKP
jgi:hypothetical protein